MPGQNKNHGLIRIREFSIDTAVVPVARNQQRSVAGRPRRAIRSLRMTRTGMDSIRLFGLPLAAKISMKSGPFSFSMIFGAMRLPMSIPPWPSPPAPAFPPLRHKCDGLHFIQFSLASTGGICELTAGQEMKRFPLRSFSASSSFLDLVILRVPFSTVTCNNIHYSQFTVWPLRPSISLSWRFQ